jgi:hypothetical protein
MRKHLFNAHTKTYIHIRTQIFKSLNHLIYHRLGRYEREEIRKHLRRKNSSPLTGQKFESMDMPPSDRGVKAAVAAWCAENGVAVPKA